MDDFQYSLWVLDKDFIPSVLLTAVLLFVFSALFSAIGTSRRVHRFVNGPDPAEVERQQYQHSLIGSLHEEILLILNGRRFQELSEDELNQVREIRQQYFSELREIGGGYGDRKQLKG